MSFRKLPEARVQSPHMFTWSWRTCRHEMGTQRGDITGLEALHRATSMTVHLETVIYVRPQCRTNSLHVPFIRPRVHPAGNGMSSLSPCSDRTLSACGKGQPGEFAFKKELTRTSIRGGGLGVSICCRKKWGILNSYFKGLCISNKVGLSGLHLTRPLSVQMSNRCAHSRGGWENLTYD